MGFVVYSKKDGEMLRYYDNRSKAQAQVTGHNRKAIMQALRGDEYSPDPKSGTYVSGRSMNRSMLNTTTPTNGTT
jgi:hypothetical protein